MPQHLPFSTSYINRYLDLILFNQSKAILKVVERYILRQYGSKTIRAIKKCYGPAGYKIESSFKSPFIEWKNECYGRWIYNINNEIYKNFNRKNPASDYEKQTFPYLYYEDNFRRDLMDTISKVDSFSLIFNLFSRLLFVYLYDRYLEIKNTYATEDFAAISPHLIVQHTSEYTFI